MRAVAARAANTARTHPARHLAWLLPVAVTVLAVIARRPDTAPTAAGLDTAIETYQAWAAGRTGLFLHGNYSWTLHGFHPGPSYIATMLTGGSLAAAALGGPWFAWGAWAAQVVVIVAGYTVATWALSRLAGARVAWATAAVLLAWQLALGPGDWWPHVAFAQPSWVGAMPPAWAAAAIACTVLTLTRPGENAARMLAITAAGMLTANHLSGAPVSVLVTGVLVGSTAHGLVRDRRAHRPVNRRQLAATALGLAAGWWWLVARLVTEGMSILDTGPDGSPLQPGPLAERPYVAWHWAEQIAFDHTRLPWWAGIALTLVLLGVLVRRVGVRSLLTWFAVALAALAWLLMLGLYPQKYTGWQTSWVEPVWIGALVVAAAALVRSALAARRRQRPASGGSTRDLAARRERLRHLGLAVPVAVCVLLAIVTVTHPRSLDASAALNDPFEQVPTEYDELAAQALSTGLPVVLSLGLNPERHATAMLFLQSRGVTACTLDVAVPRGPVQPMAADACPAETRTGPALWVVNSEALWGPVGGTVDAWQQSFQHADQWVTVTCVAGCAPTRTSRPDWGQTLAVLER
jgi:hypothetical protein